MKPFYLLFCLLALATVALAEVVPVPAPEAGAWIAVLLYNVVFPFVAALLLGLLGLCLNWLRKKFKLEANASQDEMIMQAAQRGIALAEEKAANYAKLKVGAAMEGRQKLDIAIGHVVASCPKVSPEYADQIVHSLLAMTKGAGATGDRTVE